MIDILWNRDDASLGSSVAAVNRSPNSRKEFKSLEVNWAKGLYGQWDKKTGTIICCPFLSSSFGDTANCRARRGKVCSCESVRHCHVPCEALSSLPRDKAETSGSLTNGMMARVRARQIRSLSWWWRIDLPALRLQDRPCEPLASTNVPQGHI